MKQIEQTITSLEASRMLELRHSDLLRKVKNIMASLEGNDINISKYFIKDTYKDLQNKTRNCFSITKLGCELIAHKTVGDKGNLFTVRYMEMFEKMKEYIVEKEEETLNSLVRQAPQNYIQALEETLRLAKENEELMLELEMYKPQIALANAIADSDCTITIGELAKILTQNGHQIGSVRLYQWMRDNEFIQKKNGQNTIPTQRAMNMKLFRIVEKTYMKRDEVITYFVTKVTTKGQQYFVDKFRDKLEFEQKQLENTKLIGNF